MFFIVFHLRLMWNIYPEEMALTRIPEEKEGFLQIKPIK